MFMASTYSGPIPPAGQLREYEEVLPGSADRILRMAENQADHRQDIEKIAVKGGSRRSWWGLWTGFAVAVIALILASILILNNHDWAGVTLGTGDLVALVTVFVIGRVDQRKERVQKENATRIPESATSRPALAATPPKGRSTPRRNRGRR